MRISSRTGLFLAYCYSLPAPHPIGPNITSNAQYILNDTSLAALILPNEDRQLFFSGNNGSIRRAIFTSSTEKWTVDPYIDLSVGSKLHTPLAVNIYNQNEAERAGYDPSSPITVDS